MKSKQFIGYLVLGARNIEEAKLEKGLLIWLQHKPSKWVRFWNRVLLGIFWIDKVKVLDVKNDSTAQKAAEDGFQTVLPRVRPVKKKNNGKRSQNPGTE